MEQRRLFGPDTGNSDERQDAFRNLSLQLFQHRQRAGRDERNDFRRQIIANAGDLLEPILAFRGQVRQRLMIIANRPRPVAVRPHTKGIRRLKIEDVPDQVEAVGDFGDWSWERGRGDGGRGQRGRT